MSWGVDLHPGDNKITFTIDPEHKTPETNESNNWVTVNVKLYSNLHVGPPPIRVPKVDFTIGNKLFSLKDDSSAINPSNDFGVADKGNVSVSRNLAAHCDSNPGGQCTFRTGFVVIKDKKPDQADNVHWTFCIDGKLPSGKNRYVSLPAGKSQRT